MPDVTDVPVPGRGQPWPGPPGALTAPDRPDRPAGAGPVLIAPGFGHPMLAPLEWAELAMPGVLAQWSVLDVDAGPGGGLDPFALAAVARLRVRGRPVLGRLVLDGGERPFGRLVTEANRYLDWYRVDGFYLDRCPGGPGPLAATERLVGTLRALRPGARVVLDPGGHPCRGYAELADQVVTFRGRWSEYRWSQVAEWTADFPPERFCHLVCGLPPARLPEALRIARWQGAGAVFLTDRGDRAGTTPWSALPGFWDELVSCVGMGVSE